MRIIYPDTLFLSFKIRIDKDKCIFIKFICMLFGNKQVMWDTVESFRKIHKDRTYEIVVI